MEHLRNTKRSRFLVFLSTRVVHQDYFYFVLPFWPAIGWRRERVSSRAASFKIKGLFQPGDGALLLTFDVFKRQKAFYFDLAGSVRNGADCVNRVVRTKSAGL